MAIAAFGVVAICNHGVVQEHHLGLPLAGVIMVIFLILLTFLARRTTFGRHVYAVGGNAEAARRAGINVARIRVLVFVISSSTAAIGGIMLAAYVNSVALTFPPGTLLLNAIAAAVIGGVSLFGGRGEVRGALLGSLVIATVSNGLNTAGLHERDDLHRDGAHPPGRGDARHRRAAATGPLGPLGLRAQTAGCGWPARFRKTMRPRVRS